MTTQEFHTFLEKNLMIGFIGHFGWPLSVYVPIILYISSEIH